MPELAEREAIRLLAGVGNDREWWVHAPGELGGTPIGHLRVGLTVDEVAYMTARCPVLPPVVADAGDSGPERPRTR